MRKHHFRGIRRRVVVRLRVRPKPMRDPDDKYGASCYSVRVRRGPGPCAPVVGFRRREVQPHGSADWLVIVDSCPNRGWKTGRDSCDRGGHDGLCGPDGSAGVCTKRCAISGKE